MPDYNLTGKYPSDTYGRLIQKGDDGKFYNGFGDFIDIQPVGKSLVDKNPRTYDGRGTWTANVWQTITISKNGLLDISAFARLDRDGYPYTGALSSHFIYLFKNGDELCRGEFRIGYGNNGLADTMVPGHIRFITSVVSGDIIKICFGEDGWRSRVDYSSYSYIIHPIGISLP